MFSSDQPCFDTGTSTRSLSTGVTVGGTGSSLVQTTGAAAQRVHLPEGTWASSSLSFYSTCDQCQLPQGVLSSQAQLSPQD